LSGSNGIGARAKAGFPPHAFWFGHEGILAATVEVSTQRRKGRQRRPLLLLFCRGFPRLGNDFFEVNFHRRRKGSAGVPPAASGDRPML
jgi:hypothetical protein